MHDSETRAFPHISPPSPSSNSSGYDSHLHSPANLHHATPSSTRHPPPHEDRPFNAHGWVEYLLPDESLYYVHQGYQVVADMDLSDEKLLDAMMAYLEDKCDVIPPGRELWLRDPGPREGGFAPLGWLVDHSKQSVAPHLPREANGDREGHDAQHECKDDRLDAKYRYWSFMEAHPAHTSLPPDAHQDAIDALHWATTNGLIHSHPGRSAPAPFTQEECQSLTTLLQSIRKRGETPLRTHTVSKILLRVVCWRQSHSRPDKPLPVDAGRDGLRRRDPMPVQSSGFILSTGVYVCLAAAIALYPSKIVRVAGIGALLFSLSPVVSNMGTIAQFKGDSGSITFHARRAMSMFSPKDRTVTDSRPSWRIWPWQRSESRPNKSSNFRAF
ncbi:hypothetical protein BD779DRAFT_541084 [Infundibulicybe gibba]|nr:hypothetical protein BD779DRAFT_541084 [Infundibulicybe gibba]